MQPIEIALFGAVVALAAGLIGYLLWPFARARAAARAWPARRAPSVAVAGGRRGPGRLVCPACQREYDAGLQFCPHDARELVPATDPAARAAVPGMTCPDLPPLVRRDEAVLPVRRRRAGAADAGRSGRRPARCTLGAAVAGIASVAGDGRRRMRRQRCQRHRIDGQDLPALLAALRKRRDVLRPGRLRARLRELSRVSRAAWYNRGHAPLAPSGLCHGAARSPRARRRRPRRRPSPAPRRRRSRCSRKGAGCSPTPSPRGRSRPPTSRTACPRPRARWCGCSTLRRPKKRRAGGAFT